jgi:flagellar biosynthesis/type III secretory pathway protein FliH
MNRMHATPWSLDEFVVHDVFFASTSTAESSPSGEERDPRALEAEREVRLAAERARLEADAYARGRADGERAARAMVEPALRTALGMLHEAAQSVRIHESRWVGNIEENIAALAVSVARHLVHHEVIVDPSFVTTLVRHAVAQYPLDQEITIRVAPEDLATCQAVIDTDTDGSGARALRWIGDASIERGGCLTEGRERIVDAGPIEGAGDPGQQQHGLDFRQWRTAAGGDVKLGRFVGHDAAMAGQIEHLTGEQAAIKILAAGTAQAQWRVAIVCRPDGVDDLFQRHQKRSSSGNFTSP